MIKPFVRIGTGEVYDGELPTEVVLPIHLDEPVPHSISKTYKKGDLDWEDALFRYMFLNGYCYPEDNSREM